LPSQKKGLYFDQSAFTDKIAMAKHFFLFLFVFPLFIGCSMSADTLSDGTSVIRLNGRGVKDAVFSPDGTRIATAGTYGAAIIWDAKSGKELKRLQKLTESAILSIAFSPDGKKIVAAGSDRMARIWDIESGKELKLLIGHTHPICSSSFSPDGKTVVTGSEDYSVRIWDAETGKELHEWKRVAEKIPVPSFSQVLSRVMSVSFSRDGKKIVATRGHEVLIWDTDSKIELLKFETVGFCFISAVFSPDGKRIVTVAGTTGGTERGGGAERGGTVQIWDAELGNGLLEIEINAENFFDAAFSPDGRKIATTGYRDGTVRILDAESGEELQRSESRQFYGRSIDFSPNGKTIVIAYLDDPIIWNFEQ
jgi:WD40 repeat protein